MKIASASRRFGPAVAAKASSQVLQRVSALSKRLPLFLSKNQKNLYYYQIKIFNGVFLVKISFSLK
jgi:hypothetical protein